MCFLWEWTELLCSTLTFFILHIFNWKFCSWKRDKFGHLIFFFFFFFRTSFWFLLTSVSKWEFPYGLRGTFCSMYLNGLIWELKNSWKSFYLYCVHIFLLFSFGLTSHLTQLFPLLCPNSFFYIPSWFSITLTRVRHNLFDWYSLVLVIVNVDQKYATILAYLFIPNQLYVFRAMSSSIIRSTRLYLQHLILTTDLLPVGVMDEMELQFHLIHNTS